MADRLLPKSFERDYCYTTSKRDGWMDGLGAIAAVEAAAEGTSERTSEGQVRHDHEMTNNVTSGRRAADAGVHCSCNLRRRRRHRVVLRDRPSLRRMQFEGR